MRHMAFLAGEMEALDRDIEKIIEANGLQKPHSRIARILQSLPGIQATAAATILAETGAEMKQFPSAAQFRSWSGLAPAITKALASVNGRRR